ncbi:MAG: DUF4957 domain-containing protein [Calditrichaeota bacterium]|nr:DUF4957 domain-containing protein [Calditrichota bacterium]
MKSKLFVTIFFLMIFSVSALFGQSVIQVPAGDDQIDNALYTASPGDTLELITDGGMYHETFVTIIDMPITIRAAKGLTNKPVWYTDNSSKIIDIRDDLTLDGIIFDGSLGDSLTAKGIDTPDSSLVKWGYKLKINNCEFVNFNVGDDGHAIYGDANTQADTVIISNCYFAHILQEAVRFKSPSVAPGSVKYFRIENTTLWDIGDEAIYVQAHDHVSDGTPDPVFIANHITIVKAGSKSIYPKEIDGAMIKNSIVAFSATDEYACRIYGTNSKVEHFLSFQCPKHISKKEGASYDYDLLLRDQNPYFADAEAGNFAVAANSPAALFADDSTALGDANNGTWDASEITKWELVKNKDWERLIEDALTENDTLVFVSDGGEYYNPKDVSMKKFPLVLMAKPGLGEKPTLTAAFGSSRIMKIYAPITIKGLRFRGDGIVDGGTPYGLRWDAGSEEFGTCIIEDCEFEGFRLRALHMDKKNHTDTLIVNNCIFRNVGETGIYGKDAARNIEFAKIANCTFYRVGQKGIYLRNVGELEVSHCTFCWNDSTISERTGNVGVYARDDTVVTIRDNIFYQQDAFGVRVFGPSPTVEYNLFWECDTLIKSEDHPELTFPIFNLEDDPLFKSIEDSTLNLAVEVNGPAVGMASDESNLGDPRWGTWEQTGVSVNQTTPNSFYLSQNYPNPFNPGTSISYGISKPALVNLTIYNILGQKVIALVNQFQMPNRYIVHWDGKDKNNKPVPGGIYFYRLKTDNFLSVKKMILLQ